jgi:hypothetical protein
MADVQGPMELGCDLRIGWFFGEIWFVGEIGWFVRSVPVVVLVLVEQRQGLGGLGEDADGCGAAYICWVIIALPVEDVGDAVDGGFEPDGVPGGGAGDDHFQAVFAVAAESDEPFLGG